MRYLIVLIFFIVGVSCSSSKWSVMTYNIRYDNPADGDNAWDYRREALVAQVLEFNPDFIGFQEVLHNQLQFLDTIMIDYGYIGVGRDDGAQAGEYSPIFYNKRHFSCIYERTFWLSNTPEQVSVGWDAALPRICTYGKFIDKNQRVCWIFNTHFDHIGVKAREESAALIMDRIQALTGIGDRVFLLGDFNLSMDSPPIVYLAGQLKHVLHNEEHLDGSLNHTFNGFDVDHDYQSIIDHIFFKGDGLDLINGQIIDNRGGASFLSDHHPVYSLFRIN